MENNYYLESSSNKKYKLNRFLLSIGSSADISIDDHIENLLPRHCSLCVDDEQWGRVVINLSKVRPIKVNNEVVETKKKLTVGDVIDICGIQFVYTTNIKQQIESNEDTKNTITTSQHIQMEEDGVVFNIDNDSVLSLSEDNEKSNEMNEYLNKQLKSASDIPNSNGNEMMELSIPTPNKSNSNIPQSSADNSEYNSSDVIFGEDIESMDMGD